MRIVLVIASLSLLAACGGGASNNSSANGAAPANGAAAAAGPNDPELASMRAQGISGCSAEVARRSAPGTDIARLCGCAVDRLIAGRTAAQIRQSGGGNEQVALNACAGEQGVTLTARPGASAPANVAAPVEPAEEGNSAR